MIKTLLALVGALTLLVAGGIYYGRGALADVTQAPTPAVQQANPQQLLLADLKTEVLTDPLALGYPCSSGPPCDYFSTAALLNEVGLSGETVDVAFVSTDIIQSQVLASEYLTLSAAERDLWAAVLSAGATRQGVPVANTNIRGQITNIWGAGTTTRSNLAALQTRSASRAEALFGDGVTVSDHDVEEALLLP